jgi:uncharacterized membrane protein YtjA (UPF0391 family)
MKQRYPIIILVIAALAYGTGILFRITHAPGGYSLFLAGKILGGIGVVLFVYSLVTDERRRTNE